jgi:hypothetical protein
MRILPSPEHLIEFLGYGKNAAILCRLGTRVNFGIVRINANVGSRS